MEKINNPLPEPYCKYSKKSNNIADIIRDKKDKKYFKPFDFIIT